MSQEYQDIKSKQTILQHGEGVRSKFLELITYMESSIDSEYSYPLPKWLKEYRSILLPILKSRQEEIETYLLYHDCGKPYCLEIDEQGRRHFPNHASVSQETFLKYCSNQFIAELIGKDMLCHLTKPKDYQELIQEEHIEILLCAALAEIHSNAQMFGGFDSDSFKIKFKNLNKLGQRILDEKYKNTKIELNISINQQLNFFN